MKLEIGFFSLSEWIFTKRCKFSKYEWSRVNFPAACIHPKSGFGQGRAPNGGTELRVIISHAFKLIFCKFSKTSALSSPLGKRNDIVIQSFNKHDGVLCVFGIMSEAWDAEIPVAVI